VIAILLMAAQAATPVYLTCTITPPDAAAFATDLALDEANQLATISQHTGRVAVRQAVYSPEEVRIPDDAQIWTVSRVDLTIRRSFTFTASIETGKCVLKPSPTKRAF